ncbi:MAG: hypothetical protein EOM67_00955 [Spirochaetia bacterium]|nr:hypothetical protein [Spirochaetia bacterium]
MHHHCNLCGAHLLHTDSICTKEKSSFRYTIFDNTRIIQSLKESFKIYYYDEFIIQLGTIYLQEIKRIEPLLFPDCMFQQVETDNSYTPYFNKLIAYINKVGQQNHVKERYPLLLTLGESNTKLKTLSLY